MTLPVILHRESFAWSGGGPDGYQALAALYDGVSASAEIEVGGGRGVAPNIGSSLRGSGTAILKILYSSMLGAPAATAKCGQGLAHWRDTVGSELHSFWMGNKCHVSIGFDSDGHIIAYRDQRADLGGGGRTELGRTTYTLPSTPFELPPPQVHIEAVVDIHATLGTVLILVNGVEKLNLVGKNTKNAAAAATVDNVRLVIETNCSVTDWIVHDGTGVGVFGDKRVSFLGPVSAGTYTAGVAAGSGSPPTLLNAVQTYDGDTKYVQEDDTGLPKAASFHTASLPADALSVFEVCEHVVARKDDAGDDFIRVGTIAGGTEVDNGVDLSVSSGYEVFGTPRPVNPHTGIAWTVAQVNEPIQILARRVA